MSSTDEQARIAAREVINRMNRVTDIWSVLDYFHKYGQLPQEKGPARRKIEEMSRPELIRFCFGIQPTIAKLKKRIANETNEVKKTTLQQELNYRMEELRELQEMRDNG
jgi:hypothetical protein